jgi:hypothetical protein
MRMPEIAIGQARAECWEAAERDWALVRESMRTEIVTQAAIARKKIAIETY